MIIKYHGGTRFSAEERGHEVLVDLPAEKGGTDCGMTPSELLAAAFGSCICLYVTDYCQRIGVDAEGTNVEVHYQMAKDPLRIGHVHAVVSVPKGVPDTRRAALQRVAESCPVHHTLGSKPDVQVEFA